MKKLSAVITDNNSAQLRSICQTPNNSWHAISLLVTLNEKCSMPVSAVSNSISCLLWLPVFPVDTSSHVLLIPDTLNSRCRRMPVHYSRDIFSTIPSRVYLFLHLSVTCSFTFQYTGTTSSDVMYSNSCFSITCTLQCCSASTSILIFSYGTLHLFTLLCTSSVVLPINIMLSACNIVQGTYSLSSVRLPITQTVTGSNFSALLSLC